MRGSQDRVIRLAEHASGHVSAAVRWQVGKEADMRVVDLEQARVGDPAEELPGYVFVSRPYRISQAVFVGVNEVNELLQQDMIITGISHYDGEQGKECLVPDRVDQPGPRQPVNPDYGGRQEDPARV